MSEGTTEQPGGAGTPEPGAEHRREVRDHLAAALDDLIAAVKAVGDEVEQNARAEWVRAKPELRSTVTDLQSLADAMAAKARSVLSDLEARLDPPEKRDDV